MDDTKEAAELGRATYALQVANDHLAAANERMRHNDDSGYLKAATTQAEAKKRYFAAFEAYRVVFAVTRDDS